MIKNFKEGIKNLYNWFPIIWNDRDFDWAFLAIIMSYKLKKMSKFIKENGYHVNAKKDAKRMLICSILLNRMINDDYYKDSKNADHEIYRSKYDNDYLFELMKKYFRSWWD